MKTLYSVNFYKKVDGSGWMFQSFKTTDNAVRMHLRELIRQKQRGTVRSIEANKLK
jgi:hypothetical protein